MRIEIRKAFFDFFVLEKFEAGINLLGSEVKAVRAGKVDLTGSFVRILSGEAFLVNANIFPYEYARPQGYNPTRTRKLLLHKKELIVLKSKMDGQNLTIVPISLYTTSHLIKLELALGKSKKKFDKRQDLKKKTIDRDIEEALKNGR